MLHCNACIQKIQQLTALQPLRFKDAHESHVSLKVFFFFQLASLLTMMHHGHQMLFLSVLSLVSQMLKIQKKLHPSSDASKH